MLFKRELIEKILDGKKTVTSRKKQIFEVGHVTNLMANKDYSKITGKYIRILKVHKKTLGEFTDADSIKEGFENLQDFKQYWKKNKLGNWTPRTIVWVHEFEIIKLQDLKEEGSK